MNRVDLLDGKRAGAAILLSACLAFGFQGCASHQIEDRNVAHAPSTRERAADVADQPWADLNVSKTVIPPLLVRASAAPYALPPEPGCVGLQREIDDLTRVLGPDLQPAVVDRNGSFLSKKQAGDAGWGLARGFVDGFIPFRGVIRIFSGADEHERAVVRVILAGFVRRAYLEGQEKQLSCPKAPRS
jgi:hypothetical protein